jgi:spermidine/putrescine-binding protein
VSLSTAAPNAGVTVPKVAPVTATGCPPRMSDTADPALTAALQKLLLDPQSNTADVMEVAAQRAQDALDKHR